MRFLTFLFAILFVLACSITRDSNEHIDRKTPSINVLDSDLSKHGFHLQLYCNIANNDIVIDQIGLNRGRKYVSFLEEGLFVEALDEQLSSLDRFFINKYSDDSFNVLLNLDTPIASVNITTKEGETKNFSIPSEFQWPLMNTEPRIKQYNPPISGLVSANF